MNDSKRKRVTISTSTDKKLNSYFRNNYEVGQFLTYVIENIVNQLPEKNSTNIHIEIVIDDFKIK